MMRFSEAIRAGAKAFGNSFMYATQDGSCGCAVGSALLLVRGKDWVQQYWTTPGGWNWDWLYEEFPFAKISVDHPDPEGSYHSQSYKTLGAVVSNLHNICGWSREAIAEWVETVERKHGLWDEEKKEESQTEEVSTPVVDGKCVECGPKV